jgi:CheY-like chemotaxis protein
MTTAERGSRVRVLVAEDYPDTRRTLCWLLKSWGFDVRDARDGPEALRLAHDFRPAVAILDLAMPGLDGYQVARRLRESAQTDPPLLIALTGFTDRAHVAAAREAGFDHFLAKPCSPSEIDFLLRSVPRGPHPDTGPLPPRPDSKGNPLS